VNLSLILLDTSLNSTNEYRRYIPVIAPKTTTTSNIGSDGSLNFKQHSPFIPFILFPHPKWVSERERKKNKIKKTECCCLPFNCQSKMSKPIVITTTRTSRRERGGEREGDFESCYNNCTYRLLFSLLRKLFLRANKKASNFPWVIVGEHCLGENILHAKRKYDNLVCQT
jgi:hypothetical protein